MKFRDPKTGEMCGLQGLLLAWIKFRMHRDTDWAKENAEEVASLMGYEVVEDDFNYYEELKSSLEEAIEISRNMKEANMDKPRICEVLGVEVGEWWEYGGIEYSVTGKGIIIDHNNTVHFIGLTGAINDPDHIIRKPRFTEQDVEDAKAVKRVFGRDGTVKRLNKAITDPYSNLTFDNLYINESMFPCIFEGQSYTLDEIIRGAE